MSADHQFGAALRSLAATMNELSLPWMVIGGVAVIAAGVPRETIDVDAAVLGRASDLDTLIAALGRNGIVPRIDNARQFARERQVLLLRHDESSVTMEISFAWLPFEEEALARADPSPVIPSVVEGPARAVARASVPPDHPGPSTTLGMTRRGAQC